ncbi:MAG: Crp/Fnr family transcriptional regulator [Flavobacteriales bacterium]|nr:Crp/Fnr family transcriptional regulator [Flavobacteriales bacterium]
MISTDVLFGNGASMRRFKAGEIIVREGEEPQGYFQLLSGSVRWTNLEEDGKEIIQEIVQPGESFAEFPLFDGLPYEASVLAEEESEVIWLPSEKFNDVLISDKQLMMKFLSLFVTRMRYKFLITKELSNKPPMHRLATLIHHLKVSERHVCSQCSRVLLTRQQMGNMTGLRVETVIRAIRQMNAQGEVFIKRGKIYLDNSKSFGDHQCKSGSRVDLPFKMSIAV